MNMIMPDHFPINLLSAALPIRFSTAQLAEGRDIQFDAVMKPSRAKLRDDIMALMHVTYIGKDAVPLQQDTGM